MRKDNNKKSVLFASANPNGTKPLHFEQHSKLIEDALNVTANQSYVFKTRIGVDKINFFRHLERYKPSIIHLTTHGDTNGYTNGNNSFIYFEGKNRDANTIPVDRLIEALEEYTPPLECFILMACHGLSDFSNFDAKINYIIGVSDKVSNKDAKEFTTAFYNALAHGESIETSYYRAVSITNLTNDEEKEFFEIYISPKITALPIPKEDKSSNTHFDSDNDNILELITKKYINELWDLFQKGKFSEIIGRLSQKNTKINIGQVDTELGNKINRLNADYYADQRRRENGTYSNLKEFLKYRNKWIDRLEDFLIQFEDKQNSIVTILEKIRYQIKNSNKNNYTQSESNPELVNNQPLELNSPIENIQKQIENFDSEFNNLTLLIDNDELEDTITDFATDFSVQTAQPKIKNFIKLISFVILLSVIGITIGIWANFNMFGVEHEGLTVLQKEFSINLVLHVFVIILMINNDIRPQITKIDFNNKLKNDLFSLKYFDSSFELYKFFSRSNLAIFQFGIWWKYLGISFLLLYLYYYIGFVVEVYDEGNVFFLNNGFVFEVFLNGIEAYFLYILYKLLTDKTLRETFNTKNERIAFKKMVNQTWPLATVLCLITVFILFWLNDATSGNFKLISRATSAGMVAVSMSLVIGRFDSKYIGANKFWLVTLYIYAALQALFILFDPEIFDVVAQRGKEWFYNIQVKTLYLILFLKVIFISFVYYVHKSNRLFYYFLWGTKFNDLIEKDQKEGKEKRLNPWVKSLKLIYSEFKSEN